MSLEMIVPGFVGVWLDARWGISPWLTIVGFAFGLVVAMWHLLQITKAPQTGEGERPSQGDKTGAREPDDLGR